MTRKGSRGKASTRGVMFGIIAAVVIMLLIYFFGNQSVHAITRDESNAISDEIITAQYKIKALDVEITQAKLDNTTNQDTINEKKQTLISLLYFYNNLIIAI